MCLFTGNAKPLKSDGTVQCFKILLRKGDEWITPYQREDVSRTVNGCGMIIPKTDGSPKKVNSCHYNDPERYSVEEGYIHAYAADGTGLYFTCVTIERSAEWTAKVEWKPRILLCTMPKGMDYHEEIGIVINRHSVAAKALRIERDVTEEVLNAVKAMKDRQMSFYYIDKKTGAFFDELCGDVLADNLKKEKGHEKVTEKDSEVADGGNL